MWGKHVDRRQGKYLRQNNFQTAIPQNIMNNSGFPSQVSKRHTLK